MRRNNQRKAERRAYLAATLRAEALVDVVVKEPAQRQRVIAQVEHKVPLGLMVAAVVSRSAEMGEGAGCIRLCTSFSLRRMLRMRWVELIPLGPTSTRMLSASIRIGHLPVAVITGAVERNTHTTRKLEEK
jgi:hypothetical protein